MDTRASSTCLAHRYLTAEYNKLFMFSATMSSYLFALFAQNEFLIPVEISIWVFKWSAKVVFLLFPRTKHYSYPKTPTAHPVDRVSNDIQLALKFLRRLVCKEARKKKTEKIPGWKDPFWLEILSHKDGFIDKYAVLCENKRLAKSKFEPSQWTIDLKLSAQRV